MTHEDAEGTQVLNALSRRHFIGLAAGTLWTLALGATFRGARPAGAAPFPQFFFAQLRYRGGDWDPNPLYVEAIVEELELRTSVEAFKERRVLTAGDPDLFFVPFLYMAGKYEFEPFTAQERETLKRFLSFGGFLLAEDTLGARGFGFDQAFRKELRQIFPGEELKRLPPDHSVFRSFYLLDSPGGRQRVNPFLEGITLDGGWTPVIYSQNDLSGAWARDRFGRWAQDCVPGGEAQRQQAFKTGINIVIYSLTSDYKKDLVHHPFIRKRLNP
jgi:hypothetical protein